MPPRASTSLWHSLSRGSTGTETAPVYRAPSVSGFCTTIARKRHQHSARRSIAAVADVAQDLGGRGSPALGCGRCVWPRLTERRCCAPPARALICIRIAALQGTLPVLLDALAFNL